MIEHVYKCALVGLSEKYKRPEVVAELNVKAVLVFVPGLLST